MIDHRPKMVNDGGFLYAARMKQNKTAYEGGSTNPTTPGNSKPPENRPSAVESVLGINPQTGAPSAGGAGGKLRANDLLPDAVPAAQAAGGVEVGETEAEEALDFDENLEPIVKSPYTSGSNTPRINGNPRKNAFSTEGLEEWQIDQMMEEVFGESESGFEAAGLSKEEQDAYWQRKENRDKNRKNSEPSSDRPAPARPNPFSTEGLEEWQIDQMVEEVFGESESGFEAAGLSEEEQDAYWQRKKNREKNRKNSKTPSKRPVPARPNPFSTEGLEEWQIDQMVEEIFGESESGLEAAGLSKEAQDAYWQRSGGKPGANLAGAPEGNADPAAELPGEEVLALTEAAEGMLAGEKTVEELYAEDPSRFMKWMRYLGYSFGHGLAVFYEAAMDGVDWLLGSPWRVFGGENRVTKWLEESGDQSLEFYQQRMDAAVAAMGDSAGWSKGAQVMSGFSTAFEMFLTVGIGASLIGKLTAGTAAAPLTNQKIPESTGSLKPWLDLETQYPPTYLNELVQDKLTRAQRRNVQTFINIYDNNLKYSDFTGTLKDLLGSPVLKGNGNAYNHLQEMEQSYVALKKVHRALENSLKNPNLERDVYEYLMKNYEAVSMNLRKIENLFSFKN